MRPLSTSALRSFFALVAVLVAPAVRAGTVTVNGVSGTTAFQFGLAACNTNDVLTVSYTIDTTATTSQTVAAFTAPTSGCDAPTSGDGYLTFSIADSTQTTSTITGVYPAQLLLGKSCSDVMTTAADPGIVYLCVTVTPSGDTAATETDYAEIEYATLPPDPPDAIVVQPGDQQLHVSWTQADTSFIDHYDVFCEPGDADAGTITFDGDQPSATTSSGESATVSATGFDNAQLMNNQTYSVAVTATDTYGNTSDFSAAATGVPLQVDDFYDYYRDHGGSAQGCASSDGLLWVAIVAALLFFIGRARFGGGGRRPGGRGWRRFGRGRGRGFRRRHAALLLGLSVFSTAYECRADDIDYSPSNFNMPVTRRPRRFFFALEADKYSPGVDNEADLGGATPYHDIFGDRVPWRVQAEFAAEVLHVPVAGTLLAGVSAGFWQNIGKGRFTQSGLPSVDTTLLDVWPFGVEAQWRFDALADRYRWFPLIPYVKAGLNAGLWVVYSGNGDVSSSPPTTTRSSGRGQGWTLGYSTALGVAIALDSIDPNISNEGYLDLGLQRTSLFAEYGWTRLDGFKRSGNLDLNDHNWRFGISMEF